MTIQGLQLRNLQSLSAIYARKFSIADPISCNIRRRNIIKISLNVKIKLMVCVILKVQIIMKNVNDKNQKVFVKLFRKQFLINYGDIDTV